MRNVADPNKPFAIKSSRVVTPDGEINAAVVIADGKISQIVTANETPSGIPCNDLGDLVISPGLVDAHVHINDPGTDWEGFETATRAAAAGGVTTLIDMRASTAFLSQRTFNHYKPSVTRPKESCTSTSAFMGASCPITKFRSRG